MGDRQVRQVRQVKRGWQRVALMEFSKYLRAEDMKSCCWKGAHPGVETPVIPDALDNPTQTMHHKALQRITGVVLFGGF